jgi:hypothetical protein
MKHWLETAATLLEAETTSLQELCQIAGGDPRTFYQGVDFSQLDLSIDDYLFIRENIVSDFVHRIERIDDVAIRVATVLQMAIEESISGRMTMLAYSDSDFRVRKVFTEIVRNRSGRLEQGFDAEVFAEYIQDLILSVRPVDRGRFLFEIAVRLAKFSSINEEIKRILRKHRGKGVQEYRSKIMDVLLKLQS